MKWLVLSTGVLCALPAAAASRAERLGEVEQALNNALDANDERDSDCQREVEHKIERVLREVRRGRDSDDALEEAFDRAKRLRDTVEDDCPSDITRSVVPALDYAVRKLRRIVEADDSDESDADYYPPQEEVVEPVESPPPAVSVEIDPPMVEPEPIEVAWAPPPMLVEVPDPMPGPGWYWVGGYWSWQGEWVWVRGHWRQPPQVGYVWTQPYYENRDGWVVFVAGHWRPENQVFVPPPPTAAIVRVQPRPGVVAGPRPIGPPGVFVPPPPGSKPGVIVSAPLGTPPQVVVSAPPVVKPGMRIEGHFTPGANLTKVNVTVVAPAGVTATGRAVQTSVPAAAHLAAARPAIVHAQAPAPVSSRPLPVYSPKRPLPPLPKPQPVHVMPVARPAPQAPRPAGPPVLAPRPLPGKGQPGKPPPGKKPPPR